MHILFVPMILVCFSQMYQSEILKAVKCILREKSDQRLESPWSPWIAIDTNTFVNRIHIHIS